MNHFEVNKREGGLGSVIIHGIGSDLERELGFEP